MSNIVFLIGKAGAGKDTVGKMFVDKGYHRVALADEMKDRFYQCMGLPYTHETETRDVKEQLRWSMIQYSENVKRFKGADYWFNEAFKPYIDSRCLFRFLEGTPDIVVTDIRRVEELEVITSLKLFSNANIKVYHVDRDLFESDNLTNYAISKAQELLDDTFDNNKTVKHLKRQVDAAIREITKEDGEDSGTSL